MLSGNTWSRRQSARRDADRHRAAPIYAMCFAMQAARSMYIVIISWVALLATGELAAVGRVLICWQLFGFAVGPIIGPVVDRFRRRTLFIVGEAIHATGIALLALPSVVSFADLPGIHLLYLTACLVSFGSLLSFPATQALIQLAGAGGLMRTVSVGIFSGQIGNIAGAVIGGLALGLLGTSWSPAVCAGFSVAAAAFATTLRVREQAGGVTDGGRTLGIREGVAEILGKPAVLLASVAILLAYSSSHTANALLAGFARDELAASAGLYGWIAAMYSGGGLVGSLMMASFAGALKERHLLRCGAILLAVATAGFPTAQTVAQAMVWHGLAGLSFALVRTTSDVMILKAASNGVIGRVRNNIQAAIGVVAITIYVLPSLLHQLDVRQLYLVLAVIFVTGAGLVLWMQWRAGLVEDTPSVGQRSLSATGASARQPAEIPVLVAAGRAGARPDSKPAGPPHT